MSVTEQSYCIDSKWKVWESAVSKETLCFAEGLCIFKAWNTSSFETNRLARTLAHGEAWQTCFKDEVKLQSLVWCIWCCVTASFQLQNRSPCSSMCATSTGLLLGGTDSSGICVHLGKKKKKNLSLLMVGLSSGRKR